MNGSKFRRHEPLLNRLLRWDVCCIRLLFCCNFVSRGGCSGAGPWLETVRRSTFSGVVACDFSSREGRKNGAFSGALGGSFGLLRSCNIVSQDYDLRLIYKTYLDSVKVE